MRKIFKVFLLIVTLYIDAILFYALLSNFDMIKFLKLGGFNIAHEVVLSLIIVCVFICFNCFMLIAYKRLKSFLIN